MKILFATKNKGKYKEVKNIFSDTDIELISLNDFDNAIDVVEDGSTFEENALKKAVEIYSQFKLPVISDDSGLIVEQLKGAPGIHSSRYSGDDATDKKNNIKLLDELKSFPEPHCAKFVCTAVYIDSKNNIITNDEINGQIISQPRGTNGFGYDPLFLPEGFNKTSAEISPDIKNKISHRAKAFNKLKQIMVDNNII
ncbi:MAG: RdgB/HAM1 family non-canonical purine NTP pyrophosphatase [Bacteroidetes bacterium]|nr:RdgB/HAM1 family non-canonical purine NTP pyrophosphatase [Bacteroidota bacterium]